MVCATKIYLDKLIYVKCINPWFILQGTVHAKILSITDHLNIMKEEGSTYN
jgi:hypothetical protein